MTVARIINEKGRDVVTAAPNATLADLAATLSEKRIGAIVIVADEAISGIVSERDIVRAVARHGGEALDMRASEWMTARVTTCHPEDTIDDVMRKMTEGRFRHLPVVKAGKLAGIVSIGDVVKHRMQEVLREADEIRGYIATA